MLSTRPRSRGNAGRTVAMVSRLERVDSKIEGARHVTRPRGITRQLFDYQTDRLRVHVQIGSERNSSRLPRRHGSCIGTLDLTSQPIGRIPMTARRTLTVVVTAIAIACLASSAYSQKRRRGATPDAEATGSVAITEAKVSSGQVPMLDVLRFLHFATGKTIIQPSATDDPMFREDVTINMLNDIDNLTAEVVTSIMTANGYMFYEEGMGDGRAVIHVRHVSSRQVPPIPLPKESFSATEEIGTERPNELATAVIVFQNTDAGIAIQALRELLGTNTSGSHSGCLKIVTNPSANCVMVMGKRSVLRKIRTLAKHLDLPAKAVGRAAAAQSARDAK